MNPGTSWLLPWSLGRWLVVLAGIVSSCGALEPVTVRSRSGHFVVHGLPVPTPSSGSSTSTVEYLRLDPTLTAVSLDRMRQVLVACLGVNDSFGGNVIQVQIRPMAQDEVPVRVTAVRFADGWGYQLELPERLEKIRFFHGGLQAMLMEWGNRKAGVREANLPPWLAVGLAAEMMATSLPTLALEQGKEVAQRDRSPDPMRSLRELLRVRTAVTFDELCMPPADPLAGEAGEVYRACAYLFVHELLRLRGGRQDLVRMLDGLAESLNWQTTFLRCFSAHFPRLIDADKWYALNVVSLSGRDHLSAWPIETTWKQMEEILITPIHIRLQANQLPMASKATLQQIITEWDFSRQQPVLAQKLVLLQSLRMRSAPELLDLIDGYTSVLTTYVSGRDFKAGVKAHRQPTPTLRVAPRSTLSQLNELDARRQSVRELAIRAASQVH